MVNILYNDTHYFYVTVIVYSKLEQKKSNVI